jgi:hypothetical protein
MSRPLISRSLGCAARSTSNSAHAFGQRTCGAPCASSCGATRSTVVSVGTCPRRRIAFDHMPDSASEP